MRSENPQLPCAQPPTSSNNLQLPHGRHGHGDHGGHGGCVGHGGRGGYGGHSGRGGHGGQGSHSSHSIQNLDQNSATGLFFLTTPIFCC